MNRMEVHLEKTRIGDSGALSAGYGGKAIKIQIAYSTNSDDNENRLSFGSLQIREADYENLLKALNKARKYVHNHDRNDVVMVPFLQEKED